MRRLNRVSIFTGKKAFSRLKFGKNDALLVLIFALAVGVADLAHLIGLEEEDLAESFVGVDTRRQGCGVGDFRVTNPPTRARRG